MKKYLDELRNKADALAYYPIWIRNHEAGIEHELDERNIKLRQGEAMDDEYYARSLKVFHHYIITDAEKALNTIRTMRMLLDLIESDIEPVLYTNPCDILGDKNG